MKIIGNLTLFLLLVFQSQIYPQNYLWPTNASHHLTSSFAEYRSGHFHAGIDIKTWGKEGYEVYAIRDGYVRRIRVSPYGYGKAVYLKLDNGKTVVYAHLKRFNDVLESAVKHEQKRVGQYRIDKYFRSVEYPVKAGDLIAYTGSTGIGHPHLHFEIRDTRNRPINPFLEGYRVTDNIPPDVSAVSITPLTANSRVNSDVIPIVIKPVKISSGRYQIKEPILLSGKIGFAIDCFDQANGVRNTYAAYRLNFYVDGELKFSAVYNRFSYEQTSQIVFERDYRLIKRGAGIFQKLYKDKENSLPFYTPDGDEIGVIYGHIGEHEYVTSNNIYSPGTHSFRIEAADFNGNLTAVQGDFIVGESRQIFPKVALSTDGKYYLNDIYDSRGDSIEKFNVYLSVNNGKSWTSGTVSPKSEILLPGSSDNSSIKILKFESVNPGEPFHLPAYLVLNTSPEIVPTVDFTVEKDFYDDFIRLELWINGYIQNLPEMVVQQMGDYPVEVPLIQTNYNNYYGVYSLIPEKDGPLDIEVRAYDMAGKEVIFWDQFDIETVTPEKGGRISSRDGNCSVKLGAHKVYRNLFLRIDESDLPDTSTYEVIGNAYRIEPSDVPLKRSGLVSLNYPDSDPNPEKLAVFSSSTGKRWGFSGNRLNREQNSISARLSSLRFVTLIRDTIPPEIVIYSPPNNGHLKNSKPLIRARVRDRLSRIANERSIVIRLDGRKVISELDPEKQIVKYQVEKPLTAGQHNVTVYAVDNCDNEIKIERPFYIRQ